MRKVLVCVLFISINTLFSGLFAQEMTYSKSRDGNGISVSLDLKTYKIQTFTDNRGEEMHEIELSGIFIPNDEGMPNLPRISRFVAVPNGAEVKVSVKYIETETVENINIAPALRIQAIPEEPEQNYVKNDKVYLKNELYPQMPYEISEITSLRNVDAVVVGFTPFQYNPVTKELIVIKNIELDIEFEGGTREIGNNKYRSPWFDPILRNAFLNHEMLPEIEYKGKSSRDGTGCEYLIIIPNRTDFEQYAEQIKDFRTKQGIYTHVKRLDEIGVTTTAQLKSYLHNAYLNWDIPPVAVLLMGDHNTNMSLGIPAESIYHPYSNTCITDNQYAEVVGNNNLPDFVIGRMAADTEAQMAILVSKFLEYETQPCMDPYYYQNPITALGWQTERWFQICSEAVGGYWRNMGKTPVRINAIYSGTPGSIWSSNQNTSMVVNAFGPNGTGYLLASPSDYGPLGGWTGGLPAHVVTAVNNGAFALQHRDHGFENGWGEPAFQTTHISQLNNVGKMTYLFTINCSTGKFNHSSPCFGEAFHRHTFQGQNAGCVGFLGPTEVSYSFVNDAYAWGMYDLFDPDFLPTFGPQGPSSANYQGNWLPAFGNVSGKYFLYQSNWPYNTGDKTITYKMFTAHSDVFLRLFTEVPQSLTVEHIDVQIAGNTNFIITADAVATIALTSNGEILAVATATGEQQIIEVPPTLIPTDEITVVCTAQNFLRYEAVVPVVPADCPYVVMLSYNLPENADFGKTVAINFELKNVSFVPYTASNVIVNFSTENPYISIQEETLMLGDIEAEQLYLFENELFVTVAENVPDGELVILNLLITGEYEGVEYEWEAVIKFYAYAPTLEISEVYIENQYGAKMSYIDPNIENYLVVEFSNSGRANLEEINFAVSTISQYLDIDINTDEIEILETGGTFVTKLALTTIGNPPNGTPVYLVNRASSGAIATQELTVIPIKNPTNYFMANGNLTASYNNFYDSGGKNGKYKKNENLKLTFNPQSAGKKMSVNFSKFDTNAADILYVYDGTQTTAEFLLGEFSGTNLPYDCSATNEQGNLTFMFKSTSNEPQDGWEAVVFEQETFYNVTFVINDRDDEPITDATIIFDGYVLAKNQFEVTSVQPGTYTYSVEKEDFISVIEEITIVDEDIIINVTLTVPVETYTVTFELYIDGNPVENAIIVFDGETIEGYVVEDVEPGVYQYEIFIEGIPKLTDEIEVEDEDVTIIIGIVLPSDTYTVTFELFYENGDPVTDAIIVFDGNTIEGFIVEDVENGVYGYEISKEGYEIITGEIEVEDEDWTETVIFADPIPTTFIVTFIVIDELENPIDDVTIIFDGKLLTRYTLDDVPNGTYAYIVSKEGYETATGEITIEDDDWTEIVTLIEELSIRNNSLSEIRLHPNPFKDVINIEGNSALIEKVYVKNMLGQTIREINLEGKTSIATEAIPKGIYMVIFEGFDKSFEIFKMVKQ